MSASGDDAGMSKEGSSQDLSSKYEKLAAEYAKIKAQAKVLRKAVIEEQTKNTDLKQTLREQEQSLRKNDQEMESLLFRNQQLTKRVTVLQEDLEEEKRASKKGGKKADVSVQEKNGVLDEDFKRLIQENVNLNTLIQTKEDEHNNEIMTFSEQISDLQRELHKCKLECKSGDEKYQPIIAKLEKERNEKDTRLKSLESVSEQFKTLQAKFNSLENNFKQLECFANSVSKHFFLEGLNSMQLNNVSLSDESEQVIYKFIIDIITALTSFFSQLSNRLSYLPDVTFQNKFKSLSTLCEQGKGCIQHYISKNVVELGYIVQYRSSLDTLLDNIKSLNRNQHASLSSNLLDFFNHLVKIFDVLPFLFIDKNKIYISNGSLVKVISELIIFEQLSKMLNSIFKNETDAELKSNLKNIEELTSVNDCFLESLTTLENSIQKLAVNLTQLLLGLNQFSENQTVHNIIIDFCEKACQYIVDYERENIHKSKSSEKYEIQAEELVQLKEIYNKQLKELTSKLQELEKDKKSLENQYEVLLIKNSGASSLSDHDKKILQYYKNELNALIEDKHKAEGRANMMTSECTALHRRLEFLVDSEHELNEMIVKWKQYAAQLKDDLRSTTDNYETQLSVMSEHLVDLNVDLNLKRDAIEQLQLTIKDSKGGKGKS